jgi:large subunit ribosomal protein L10
MKRLGAILRQTLQNRIKDQVGASDSLIIISYAKLSSPDITNLRKSLKEARATIFVAKNSITKKALQSVGRDALIAHIDGPCGLVFCKDEPVDISRVLCNFAKDKQDLKIRGGYMKENVLTAADIEALSKLPSRDVLRAKVCGALKAPLCGMVMVLKGNLQKLVLCLEQIKNKRTT